MGRSVSNQQSLARLAKRLSIPLEHNPLLEDEHGLCGCVQCYLAWTAKPPPDSKLEQRVMPLLLAELFQNGGARSPAINLLLQLVAEEKASQREKSQPGQPRRSRKQEAKLKAAKDAGRMVPEGEVTRERLIASREDWIYSKGTAWGWLEYAARSFRLSQKTIRSRMK